VAQTARERAARAGDLATKCLLDGVLERGETLVVDLLAAVDQREQGGEGRRPLDDRGGTDRLERLRVVHRLA
jgi:hypothetical protein